MSIFFRSTPERGCIDSGTHAMMRRSASLWGSRASILGRGSTPGPAVESPVGIAEGLISPDELASSSVFMNGGRAGTPIEGGLN